MNEPYQVMPQLTEPEYEALKASIAAGYDPAHPVVTDEDGNTLDGHHRQRACAELGITAPAVILPGLTEDQKHDYAMRANLACRHLTQAQKRELIRAELDRDGSRSDRAIGKLCGVDHKTVGAVRRGEIPHPDDLTMLALQVANRIEDRHRFRCCQACGAKLHFGPRMHMRSWMRIRCGGCGHVQSAMEGLPGTGAGWEPAVVFDDWRWPWFIAVVARQNGWTVSKINGRIEWISPAGQILAAANDNERARK